MGDTSKRYKPEQIASMLREAEVELSRGQPIAAVAMKPEITDQNVLPMAEGVRWHEDGPGHASEGA